MDVFGTVTGAIGLAATVFTTAKSIRDNIKLVRNSRFASLDHRTNIDFRRHQKGQRSLISLKRMKKKCSFSRTYMTSTRNCSTKPNSLRTWNDYKCILFCIARSNTLLTFKRRQQDEGAERLSCVLKGENEWRKDAKCDGDMESR